VQFRYTGCSRYTFPPGAQQPLIHYHFKMKAAPSGGISGSALSSPVVGGSGPLSGSGGIGGGAGGGFASMMAMSLGSPLLTADTGFTNNAPPACLTGVLAKLAKSEKKLSDGAEERLRPKLMQSMFLSGVDMEEVDAALAPVERLVDDDDLNTSSTASPIRDAARERLNLSHKSGREKLVMPRVPHLYSPEEKAEIAKKLESGEMSKMIASLKPKPQKHLESVSAQSARKLNEKIFDKNGNPVDGTVIATSLNEVTKKKLPKIVLTGKNSNAPVDAARGSDYFVDANSIGMTVTAGVVDQRNYYGLEARQKLFHHYRKMTRQSLVYSGNESNVSIDEVNEFGSVYSTLAAARNNIQQRQEDNTVSASMSQSLSSPAGTPSAFSLSAPSRTSQTSLPSKVSPYSGLHIKNVRRTPAHPVESAFLSKLDVFAGVDEELVKATRRNYFSYKCLAQKIYKDDDDDEDGETDFGSEPDSKGSPANSPSPKPGMSKDISKIFGVEGSMSLLTGPLPSPAGCATIEEEAAVMSSPRTKYIGGCIREGLAPLPRLVCRAHYDCKGIDVADYGFGDRSKYISCWCMLAYL
jgi:hypothetical protein